MATAALALRLIGTPFGLPYHYHWDEPTLLNRVIRMGSGDLNPHYFWYPSFLMYVGLAAEGMLYVVGHLLGVYRSADSFAAAYFEDSTAVYLLGRVLVALIGAATVVLTYVVGRRYFDNRTGLLAMVFIAVAPIQVSSSHFFTTDVPMTFFVLLSYLFLWDAYTRGRRRDFVFAGIAIGLGIATKYLPGLLLISLVVAHIAAPWRRTLNWWPLSPVAPLLLGVAAAGATFFLASPFVFLDWRTALHDYGLLTAQKTAQGCVDCSASFLPYVTQALPWSVGLPVYVAALAGLASVPFQPSRRRLDLTLFWSFPVLLFLVVGAGRQPLARYLVPLAPFLALAAADVIWRLGLGSPEWVRRARRWMRPRFVTSGFVAVLASVAVIPPLFDSVRYDVYLTQSDPRTAAAQWFDSNVPTGTTIAIQPIQSRYFLTAPIMTEGGLATIDSYIPSSKPGLRSTVDAFFRSGPVYPDVTFAYDVAKLRSEGVRYVVLSSAHYHNVDPAIEDPFYADLARSARVAARFEPAMQIPGATLYPAYMPTITIYELNAS